ncbi:MAG: 50S ribosomal protein L10 [Thermovirga sp.]|nr:50S ribosomal protein L10 [Thermovirga sp.]
MPSQANYQKVEMLREKIAGAQAVFVCEYRGLTVEKITKLRAQIRDAGGEMTVAKNTLMKIALKEEGFPIPEDLMSGPNGFTAVHGDPVAVAKVLKDFAKEKGNEALVIKGGILGDKVLEKEQLLALADLPPKEVLLAQVVGTMAAPIQGLVTVLSGPARGLVTCLSQIKDQKEAA